MKRLLFIVSILFLTACASEHHVTIKSDEFSRGIEITGVADYANPFGERVSHLWRLRSFINPYAHTVTHQAYFYITYTGHPKNFKSATDENAKTLKVTTIHKVDCMGDTCEKSETAGIAIDDAALRQHVDTGYRIKIRAKSGDEFILTFTPDMIRQQLDAVDKYISSQH